MKRLYYNATAACHISTIAGTAFFFIDTVDLAAYQTGDLEVTITDGAGKVARGYISSTAPAGLTLGLELMTNGDNEAAMAVLGADDSNTSATAAQSAAQAHSPTQSMIVTATGTARFSHWFADLYGVIVSNGMLYYVNHWAYVPSGQGVGGNRLAFFDGANWKYGDYIVTQDAWFEDDLYITSGSQFRLQLELNNGTVGDVFYSDDISIKQVTEPAATGALIVSKTGGSTRNFASVASGFNANAATHIVEIGYTPRQKGLLLGIY